MGRNHILVGTAVAVSGSLWVGRFARGGADAQAVNTALLTVWRGFANGLGAAGVGADVLEPVNRFFQAGAFTTSMRALRDYAVPLDGQSPWYVGYLVLALALVMVGTVVPDIDNERSLLGRHLHVFGAHRGFMHSDWLLWIVLLASTVPMARPLFWLWFGMMTHDVLDGFSRAGRARLYPFGKWKRLEREDGTASIVKTGRWRRGYIVGGATERLVVVVVVFVCSLVSVTAIWL